MRDQLATQLMLAIASGELAAGKRLPSTRALARRFRLNANTVSAAYRQLEQLGWVDSVRGSGIYVREKQSDYEAVRRDALDCLITPLLRAARSTGISAAALRDRIDDRLNARPRRFVVLHPDEDLRRILCAELRPRLAWQVEDCAPTNASIAKFVSDSVFVTVPGKQNQMRALVPANADLIALQIKPVERELTKHLPAPARILIVIASGWTGFLEIAGTVLTAAGLDADAMMFRDTRRKEWRRGLGNRSVIVCDVLTAAAIPDSAHKIVFHLVSDASIAALVTYEQFFR